LLLFIGVINIMIISIINIIIVIIIIITIFQAQHEILLPALRCQPVFRRDSDHVVSRYDTAHYQVFQPSYPITTHRNKNRVSDVAIKLSSSPHPFHSCSKTCVTFGTTSWADSISKAPYSPPCVYTRDTAISVALWFFGMFAHIIGWLLPLCLLNRQVNTIREKLVTLPLDRDGTIPVKAGCLTIPRPMRLHMTCDVCR
jgi:hypothetical protein